VSECSHYRRDEGEPIAPFVGDQHAEMVCLASAHSLEATEFRSLLDIVVGWEYVPPQSSAGNGPGSNTRSARTVDLWSAPPQS
jgi:hypothetical protein